MKKLLLTVAAAWMAAGLVMGGGIVTNTNQSASWVRMPVRDASRDIDAVFYNPAGLFKIKDGFHFSINNQYINQKQEVQNFYKGPGGLFGLNQSLYKGTVLAPVFPGIYGVYKKGNLAISFGVNPIGGGGGAEFKSGLPSFEMPVSDLVPGLASYGAQGYKLDTYFKGTSIYMGYQLGVSYKLSDMIQVYLGARYVTVKNTYSGYLKNIQVDMSGTWTPAPTVFNGLATQATAGATGATTIATNMDAIITGSGGALSAATLWQAQQAGAITSTQRLGIIAGLTQLGIDTSLSLSGIQTTATGTAAYLTNSAATATATAMLVSDQIADVTQTGSGITPIVGVNLTLSEKLNVGIKYEFATKMDVTNKTTKDVLIGFNGATPVTMFPDGAKTKNDMPAFLSVGAEYALTDKITIDLGTHYYFDKSVNYGKKLNGVAVDNKAVIDKNYIELAGGLQFKVNDKILVSAGYLNTQSGVSKDYQSDLSYSLSTNTFGFGGQYSFSENLKLNVGYAYTAYKKADLTFEHSLTGVAQPISYNESFWKNTQIVAVGLDISF